MPVTTYHAPRVGNGFQATCPDNACLWAGTPRWYEKDARTDACDHARACERAPRAGDKVRVVEHGQVLLHGVVGRVADVHADGLALIYPEAGGAAWVGLWAVRKV